MQGLKCVNLLTITINNYSSSHNRTSLHLSNNKVIVASLLKHVWVIFIERLNFPSTRISKMCSNFRWFTEEQVSFKSWSIVMLFQNLNTVSMCYLMPFYCVTYFLNMIERLVLTGPSKENKIQYWYQILDCFLTGINYNFCFWARTLTLLITFTTAKIQW